MADQFVYSSDAPETLAAWREYTDARLTYRSELDALEAELGLKILTFGQGGRFAGLKPDPEVETPAGWRAHKDHDMLVPDLRTKAGKAWEGRVVATRSPERCPMPGVSSSLMRDGYHWFEPGIFHHDGTIWVAWGTDADPDMDQAVWVRRRLSEFYAAREGIEAEAAAGV